MFEIVLSNGDSAEAATPEAAVSAARRIYDEAVDLGGSPSRLLTAAIYNDGSLVRTGLRRNELGGQR